MTRGYFGIGIEHTKNPMNVGTLWRSASLLGAAFMFTVGRRYQRQSSDTLKAWKHIPLFHYATMDQLFAALPFSCPLVGVELEDRAVPLADFAHPERAIYLLGAEDNGLTPDAIKRCHSLVQLPGRFSMNVSVAGSIVMYDRHAKMVAKAAGVRAA